MEKWKPEMGFDTPKPPQRMVLQLYLFPEVLDPLVKV